MSQTKYKLPDDLKLRCIAIVRGYDRCKQEYERKRREILYSRAQPPDGQPKGNLTGDSTYYKARLLNQLENEPDTKFMRAVEQARNQIGNDIVSDMEREKLKSAIWDSCILGRNFYLPYYPLAVEKTCFYEHRRKFLYNIAEELGYISRWRTVQRKNEVL